MRGNPVTALVAGLSVRSIPAYAGEPPSKGSGIAAIRVYPRVCGGTPEQQITAWVTAGLSPRMRGNRTLASLR